MFRRFCHPPLQPLAFIIEGRPQINSLPTQSSPPSHRYATEPMVPILIFARVWAKCAQTSMSTSESSHSCQTAFKRESDSHLLQVRSIYDPLRMQVLAMAMARWLLPVPVPPISMALRWVRRKSPEAISRTRVLLTGVPAKSKSSMPLASGRLAMVIWYIIERDYFSAISALSISPTICGGSCCVLGSGRREQSIHLLIEGLWPAIRVLGRGIGAGCGRLSIALHGLGIVMRYTRAVRVHQAEFRFSRSIPLARRFTHVFFAAT